MKAQFKNLTPHPIHIVDDEGNVQRTIESSGLVRLTSETMTIDEVDGIPLSKTMFGDPFGLPEFEEGVFLIVSQMVKSALPHRKDLLVPAEVVRDGDGRIIGCKSLGL